MRIVGLKPVSKRGAEHACRGSRGTSLGDEVIAIKEVGGVTGIKMESLEAFEGSSALGLAGQGQQRSPGQKSASLAVEENFKAH